MKPSTATRLNKNTPSRKRGLTVFPDIRFESTDKITIRLDPLDTRELKKLVAELGEPYSMADVLRLGYFRTLRVKRNKKSAGLNWLKGAIDEMKEEGIRRRKAKALICQPFEPDEIGDGGLPSSQVV